MFRLFTYCVHLIYLLVISYLIICFILVVYVKVRIILYHIVGYRIKEELFIISLRFNLLLLVNLRTD